MSKHSKLKARLWRRQNGLCCYCLRQLSAVLPVPNKRVPRNTATLEHLRRRADGGRTSKDNCALACFHCNSSRGDMNWVEYATSRRDWPKPAIPLEAAA